MIDYLREGTFGTVWVTCKRSDGSINFDPDCKYAAKFAELESKQDEYHFEKEFSVAKKKMSNEGLTIKLFDHYIVYEVLEFENLKKKNKFDYGVIIMERWPMTLWNYIRKCFS